MATRTAPKPVRASTSKANPAPQGLYIAQAAAASRHNAALDAFHAADGPFRIADEKHRELIAAIAGSRDRVAAKERARLAGMEVEPLRTLRDQAHAELVAATRDRDRIDAMASDAANAGDLDELAAAIDEAIATRDRLRIDLDNVNTAASVALAEGNYDKATELVARRDALPDVIAAAERNVDAAKHRHALAMVAALVEGLFETERELDYARAELDTAAAKVDALTAQNLELTTRQAEWRRFAVQTGSTDD